MLTKTMQAALNDQVRLEFAAAYQYLAMSAWFESQNLPGQARWMRRQAAEEAAHAMKVVDYIHERDGRVLLQPIAKPALEFKSVVEVWEQALEHERKVSAAIHALYAAATKEADFATAHMLQWFVGEQVEEEATARGILDQARLIGPGSALFFFDRHLGKDAEKGD
jgi:ferritin